MDPKNIKVPFKVKICAMAPSKAGPSSSAAYPDTEMKLTADTIGILFCLAAVDKLNGVMLDIPMPMQQKSMIIITGLGKSTIVNSPVVQRIAP